MDNEKDKGYNPEPGLPYNYKASTPPKPKYDKEIYNARTAYTGEDDGTLYIRKLWNTELSRLYFSLTNIQDRENFIRYIVTPYIAAGEGGSVEVSESD